MDVRILSCDLITHNDRQNNVAVALGELLLSHVFSYCTFTF